MFAQVHAYAEHATRTRPNMNDVGRALEERNISTSQLDSYLDSESVARTDPAIASIVLQLNRQAMALDSGGHPTSHMPNSESSVFFNDKAESILRKLVEGHVKTEEERMEKERQREQARKAAAQADMVASSRPQQGPADAADSASVDKRMPEPRRVRINIDSYSDPESDADEAIITNGGDETDDDIEGEEDADFEAPAVNITHGSNTPPFMDITPRESEAIQGENNNATDTVQPKQHQPEGESNSQGGMETQRHVHEVERVLLPSSALPSYIPLHCPPFPSPHTYKRTPVFPEREQDFFRNRMHKAEQSRQAEENLQRLISDPRVDQNSILPNESSYAKRRRSSAAKTIDETEGMAVVTTETLQPGLVSTTTATATTAETNRLNDKHNARKMLQNLFPPANFRNVHKRTQLTSFMN
ncbi:hypothetical protein LPJ59_001690 [Coemansia sp. RSA 2399]|nr:hypothetical protein LPJ59_001690 [Coemansia sp. RSA 2399]